MNTGSQYHGGAGKNTIIFMFWEKFTNYCYRVCQLPYSHILHVENLSSEWEMFLSDTKIRENIKLPWNNKSKDESYQKYIKQLSEDEQEQLYSKYEADFTMFGYPVIE